ncbi:hypothetical protein ACOSQ3_022278 [Xanthoceras sorbifolium]
MKGKAMDSSPSHLQEISGIRQQNANKQRKLRSDVWRHFEKYKDNDGKDWAKCNLCSKVFDGSSRSGTTRLRNHFKSCQRKTSGGGGAGGVEAAGNLTNPVAIKENNVILDHLDATRLLIEGGELSPNSIELVELMDVYNQDKEKLCKYFQRLSCRFSLTINQVQNEDNIYLMVHFIDDDWNLKELIIGLKLIEDNQDFKKYLKNVLLEWGIHNNISSMVKIPNDDTYVMSCNEIVNWFSSQGSLPFNNKLLYVDPIGYISDKCNGLLYDFKEPLYNCMANTVGYIKETSSKNEKFQIAIEKAKFLGKEVIVEIIPTKQEMLNMDHAGLLKFAMGLKEAFFELENKDSEFKSINLTKEEWDRTRDLHECYQDFTAYAFVSHGLRYNTANMYFPLICNIYMRSLVLAKHEVSFDDHDSYGTIKRDVHEYWSEYNFVLAIAAVLDPRFKMDIVKRWYKKIYGDKCEEYLTIFTDYINSVYNEYAKGANLGSQETNSSISYKMLDPLGKKCESSHDSDHIQSLNSELHQYLNEVKFPLMEDFDILEWWRNNNRYFPILSKMARDFLSMQISTDFTDYRDEIEELDSEDFDSDVVM